MEVEVAPDHDREPDVARAAAPLVANSDLVTSKMLTRRWPNGVVPYNFKMGQAAMPAATEAMIHANRWRELTKGAVRFVHDTTPAGVHVEFFSDGNLASGRNSTFRKRGYSDAVGDIFDVRIWVSSSWVVHHELGHVLGLHHADLHPLRGASGNPDSCRLEYSPGTIGNHPAEPLDEFLGRYVPDSVMHYQNIAEHIFFAGSTNVTSSTTSACRPPTTDIPSDHDVAVIRKLYGVNGDWLNDTDWCIRSDERIYAGDFNDDGATDILCHSIRGDGRRWQRFGSPSSVNEPVSDTTRIALNAFCWGTGRSLHVGDFNGDGRDDSLCHNNTSGTLSIDFANTSGHMNSQDWNTTDAFCTGTSSTILVGDFDGDEIDDLVCHNRSTGTRTIAYGPFDGRTRFTATNNWCSGSDRRVVVGKFDGDNQSDLLCHRTNTGTRAIDYANNDGALSGTNWDSQGEPQASAFCWGADRTIYAGDADGNGRDDLLCHNALIGSVSTLLSGSPLQSNGSMLWESGWYAELGFCNAQDAVILLGNFGTAGGSTDLFCYNEETGHQAIRYSNNTPFGDY